MSGPGLFGGGQIAGQVNPLSSQANPYFNMAAQQQSNYLAQQAMHNYYNQQAMAMNKWMFDGVPMDINEFADQVFGADTPEKTFFLLKHKKDNN